jgi:hypothetical protein
MADTPNPSEQVAVVNDASVGTGATGAGSRTPAPAPPTARAPLAPDDFVDDDEFDPELDLPLQPAPKKPAATSVPGEPPAAPVTSEPPAPASPAPPAPAPKPRHPRLLRQQAIDLGARLGVTPAQIDAASTEDLEDWVEYQQAQRLHQTRAQPEPAAAQQRDELDLDLDESQYDPGLVNALKKFSGAAKKQRDENRQLHEKLTAFEQREAQRRASSTAEQFDAAFDALGDGYAPRFGKGDIGAVSEAEAKRRLAVLLTAGIDVNNPPPPRVLRQRLREAAETLYGAAEARAPEAPPPAAPAPKPTPPKDPVNGRFVPPTAEQWDAAALGRPSARNGAPEPHGVKRATRAVAALIRERFADSDEENDLPE